MRNFARTYARSKLGMAGLIILLFFLTLSLAAPLLTPYDPIDDAGLAKPTLPPTWVSQLEGQPTSPYLTLPAHYHFNNPSELQQWATSLTGTPGAVSVGWTGTEGYLTPTNRTAVTLGALNITFARSQINKTYTGSMVKMEDDFSWPAGAVPPSSFDLGFNMKADITGGAGFSLAFLVKNSEGKIFTLFNSSYVWEPFPLPEHYQHVGDLFAANLTQYPNHYDNWGPGYKYDSRTLNVKWWLGDVFATQPEGLVFTKPGGYTFIMQASFNDTNPVVPTTVHVFLDDVFLEIKGNTWGLLGLDLNGHDLWSQLIYGSRISLTIGIVASLVAVVIGLLVGMVAGYFGGAVDNVLMRITDVLLTIPFLPLVLVLSIMLSVNRSASFTNLIIVLGVLGWAGIARIIRSQVLSVKELTYVEAAKAIGAGDGHIISKHILPNVSPLIWVNLALAVPTAIVTEAAVSFLGLGDVNSVSWGLILYYAEQGQDPALWWRFVPPGICIALVSLAFLLVGYSLDEILNPRLRAR